MPFLKKSMLPPLKMSQLLFLKVPALPFLTVPLKKKSTVPGSPFLNMSKTNKKSNGLKTGVVLGQGVIYMEIRGERFTKTTTAKVI